MKKAKVVVNIEPQLKDSLDRVAEKHDLPLSAFGRKIFIEYLDQQGLLPPGLAVEALVGK